MNRAKLKNYAPQARRDFIQAMTDRAAFYGLTPTKTEPVVERGDVAVIAGREHPRAVAQKRKLLEDRLKRNGFGPTMEALAYTWFNRLVAVRFMELHGYFDHGYRVLSARPSTTDNTDGTDGKTTHSSSSSVKSVLSVVSIPEILLHAEHVDLPGLKREAVIDLKLAGNKESELYRLLLTAQCNALHAAMPFLFERIDDETELLLPDNLLHSDSLIRKLVNEIDEEDWQEVEIIGWLYQFYISEKKDEVIGKVVASEDIPAATQLFTPNWIVKYLVQNTLGRIWLEHCPDSPLKAKMAYYIEPAEQTPEVQSQLNEIIRQRVLTTDNTDRTDGKEKTASSLSVPSVLSVVNLSLNPEKLTLLDPACGSGHILVEGYDLFKAIYQERGYRAKDIPALILRKNLFGLEIDDRAAQLASFALMMKARADDRRIFESEAKPNVLALQDSQGINAAEITDSLNSPINKEDVPSEYLFEEIQDEKDGLFSKKALAEKGHVSQGDIASLLALFENAKTFGSLIQVPPKLAAKLPEIEKRLEDVLKHGDLTHASAHVLKPLLQQARLLARQYDAVVANPPYMGSKHFNTWLKDYIKDNYKAAKADLCVAFIDRGLAFTKHSGLMSMITMQSWMFLSSFEDFRLALMQDRTMRAMIHLGPHAFPEIGGQVVQVTAFVVNPQTMPEYRGSYRRLIEGQSHEKEQRFHTAETYTPNNADFAKIPGSPVAYWVSQQMRNAFASNSPVSSIAAVKQGMSSADNPRFTRKWWEVSFNRIVFNAESRGAAMSSKRKWFPYNKGGAFRKWYGNLETLIDWQNDGESIRQHPGAAVRNQEFFFREGVTWTDISSSCFGVRLLEKGALFANTGSCCFSSSPRFLLGYLATPVAFAAVRILNPSLHTEIGDVSRLPLVAQESPLSEQVTEIVEQAIAIARLDWDASEKSWHFQALTVFQHSSPKLQTSQEGADIESHERFRRMKELEEKNNFLFIHAFDLQCELSPEVPDDQITLYRPDRADDIKRLVSYAIGCMMGRYSLDKPGLIYAHSGNVDFDKIYLITDNTDRTDKKEEENSHSSLSVPSVLSVVKFLPDNDGIIPLLETDWGIRDDATNRLVEFVNVCWPGNLTTDSTENTDKRQKDESVTSLSVPSVLSVVKSSPHLEENLKFIADSLGSNNGEQPRDTIRRYLATGFFKHHLSMYKKRPIYWLFSSGKQRAFQCLVYLHRYHEGTLARMRTEYVIPLQGQIAARIEQLEGDKAKAGSTSHRNKLQKEQTDLKKQQTELLTFEEKLKHAADQKISLDLDDGVKVNYAKFGDLLAEAKAICGTKEDD